MKMKSRIPVEQARKLWALIHAGDHGGVFRTAVYRGLQRGWLKTRLTDEEVQLALRLVKAEMERLGTAKKDAALETTRALKAFLESASSNDPLDHARC